MKMIKDFQTYSLQLLATVYRHIVWERGLGYKTSTVCFPFSTKDDKSSEQFTSLPRVCNDGNKLAQRGTDEISIKNTQHVVSFTTIANRREKCKLEISVYFSRKHLKPK